MQTGSENDLTLTRQNMSPPTVRSKNLHKKQFRLSESGILLLSCLPAVSQSFYPAESPFPRSRLSAACKSDLLILPCCSSGSFLLYNFSDQNPLPSQFPVSSPHIRPWKEPECLLWELYTDSGYWKYWMHHPHFSEPPLSSVP